MLWRQSQSIAVVPGSLMDALFFHEQMSRQQVVVQVAVGSVDATQ